MVSVWVNVRVAVDGEGRLKELVNNDGLVSDWEPIYDPYEVVEELDLEGEDGLDPVRGLAARYPGVEDDLECPLELVCDVPWDSKIALSWLVLPGGGRVLSAGGSVDERE
jgi:hypothetical protein